MTYSMKMNYDPEEICYLCGSQLGNGPVNIDHVFQQQFITRAQPKAKGYDYAGFITVHEVCNRKFGTGSFAPENICGKALRVLEVLHSKDTLKMMSDDPI